MSKVCAFCGTGESITFHHLIPRTCHSNKWFKKNFDRIDMLERGIDICRKCHYFIHEKFPEKILGRELNTLEKLKENEIIRGYIKWAKNHRWGFDPHPIIE